VAVAKSRTALAAVAMGLARGRYRPGFGDDRGLDVGSGRGFGVRAEHFGASVSVAVGSPNWWLLAFVSGIVVGGFVAARISGGWSVRGESAIRYGRLGVGGFLLGGGGWVAGGCNLGHGLSGAAQLNVSSWVVVASMAGGVGVAHALARVVASQYPRDQGATVA
jgi:uncharacterized membrane protein YedE/YeeE